jgi:glutamate synthase (NADPH/NADH) small chain
MLFKMESAHEELEAGGGDRVYAVSTAEFLGDEDGNVRALRVVEVEGPAAGFRPVPGTEREIPAELVTLAMGFVGPEKGALLTDLAALTGDPESFFDARGNVARDVSYETAVDGVFAAGDMGRGQSLIVWAIAEGRSAAASVDRYLTGTTALPVAIPPTARSLV